MRRLIAAALFGLACASPGMPPGGPPDVAAPQIVSISPDSGSVSVKQKEVIFRFDEVVGERPPSVTTLSDLFLISPRDGIPDASWHRDAIAVKPTHGWRPNTPYTVIMMRGLADLRGNVRNTGAMTFFSTGPTIPPTRISGHAFDWVSGTPANGALIEAYVRPDSTHPYVAVADSSGAFVIEHLLAARYSVKGYLDRNKNLAADPSEPWDSVSVNLVDSARIELLLFTHDSLPPRIHDVSAIDSLTLRVSFDQPVDPTQTLTAANFAVIGPDSARIPIATAGPPPKDTSAKAAPPAIPAPKAVMSRPAPLSSAIIRLQHPLTPKVVYRIRVTGIRGLLGHTGDSERAYTPPPPLPAAKPAVTPPTSPPPIKR